MDKKTGRENHDGSAGPHPPRRDPDAEPTEGRAPSHTRREEGERAFLSKERERAALLASVLRHEAARKTARSSSAPLGPKPILPRLSVLILFTLLAVYVWFGNPAWLTPNPVPLPTLPAERTAVEAAVWLGTQQVESFRRRNGRVPGVQEMGPLPPGVRYERTDARSYVLVGEGERVSVTFRSGDPVDPLEAAARRILEGPEGE